jgi:hypothetical protein
MMRDSPHARGGDCPEEWNAAMETVVLMPEGTHNQQSEIEATKASAHLPGLDIDIIRRQSSNGDWEQVSINIRATPSFEALGRSFEMADPFTLWVQAARLMWMPWLLAAQTMELPDGRPRALTRGLTSTTSGPALTADI